MDYALKDYSASIVNTGWVPRKGYLYYYINYKMQRGWLDLGAAKYYLDPAGRMVTGWLPLEDSLYYLQPDGVMAVGFTPIGLGNVLFWRRWKNAHRTSKPQWIVLLFCTRWCHVHRIS